MKYQQREGGLPATDGTLINKLITLCACVCVFVRGLYSEQVACTWHDRFHPPSRVNTLLLPYLMTLSNFQRHNSKTPISVSVSLGHFFFFFLFRAPRSTDVLVLFYCRLRQPMQVRRLTLRGRALPTNSRRSPPRTRARSPTKDCWRDNFPSRVVNPLSFYEFPRPDLGTLCKTCSGGTEAEIRRMKDAYTD